MNKLDGVLWCIDQFAPNAAYHALLFRNNRLTLQQAHSVLCEFPYMGKFMAYEVVTDLRHTALLRHAEDIHSWANMGPGAARGLGRVFSDDPGHWNYNSDKHQELMLAQLSVLLELAHGGKLWPSQWPGWEAREVEHCLCEFDKYERVRLGEGKPKQRFNST